MYPDIWIPHEVVGASATTYFGDYAYLVNSSLVRSVRFGGNWNNGANDGGWVVLSAEGGQIIATLEKDTDGKIIIVPVDAAEVND